MTHPRGRPTAEWLRLSVCRQLRQGQGGTQICAFPSLTKCSYFRWPILGSDSWPTSLLFSRETRSGGGVGGVRGTLGVCMGF